METHNYPLRLTTEASIDLADDEELLDLMYRANFRSVFIGIETPRIDSLIETKKFQNVRGDSLEAKLARIQSAGLDINAGFIVGFDNDNKAIFDNQFRFIQDNGITLAMVGMLQAIPRSATASPSCGCSFVPCSAMVRLHRWGRSTPGTFLHSTFYRVVALSDLPSS
ncbi:MAG: hypothetical protein DWI25_06830 [Planctomycetota bacterium]|nr:MAG: hypothetical protein DWI25_06830 [Planctomycetota bacterium]